MNYEQQHPSTVVPENERKRYIPEPVVVNKTTEVVFKTDPNIVVADPIRRASNDNNKAISWQQNQLLSQLKIKTFTPNRTTDVPSKAVVFKGSNSVELVNLGIPLLMEPGDAIVRITSTGICGTDVHAYMQEMSSDMAPKGMVLGHEAVGIVDSVGSNVTNFKAGDRVAISAIIMCGDCDHCKKGQTSLCSRTNPSLEMKNNLSFPIAACFGLGGFDGLQAEHARVPLADFQLLKLPDTISDDKALPLSDIMCTAWHGLMNAEVDSNTNSLAIWGAGPVGLLAVQLAKHLGVKRIVSIDHHDYRLEKARFLGAEPLNFDKCEEGVLTALLTMFPDGVEKCLDCAGFRFSKSLTHRVQRALSLETDSPEILTEMIKACQKGGTISLIGEYVGTANSFPIGALMEKGITLRGGHVWVQKYWKDMLALIESGFDPSRIYTHSLDLSAAEDAYKMVKRRDDGVIKVLLRTRFYDKDHCGFCSTGATSVNVKTTIKGKETKAE
jgi:threonine dehydrogenase-like Zn-dependent dehydrogenase